MMRTAFWRVVAATVGATLWSCALAVRPSGETPDSATHDAPIDQVVIDAAAAEDGAQDGSASDDADAPDVPPIVYTSGCYPPCLEDLFRPCVGAGACAEEYRGSAIATYCYANGVVWSYSITSDGYFGNNTATRDGQVCWNITYLRPSPSGSTNVVQVETVHDGMGRVVGTITITSDSVLSLVTCEGRSYLVDHRHPDCATLEMPLVCNERSCMR